MYNLEDEPPLISWICLAIITAMLVFTVVMCYIKVKEITTLPFVPTQQSVVYQWESPRLQFQTLATLTGNDLIDCLIQKESGGNPYAYNPKDVDGRPKYGLLQFDSRTFDHFCVNRYGLENDLWNPDVQVECCREMISDGLARHWGTLKYCK